MPAACTTPKLRYNLPVAAAFQATRKGVSVKIEGSYEFDGSPTVVWQILLDPAALRGIIPGCRNLEQRSGREYAGEFVLAGGPFDGVYSGTAVLSDVVEHQSYRLHLHGLGPHGPLEATAHVRLQGDDTRTVLRYDAEVAVLGGLAQTTPRLLQSNIQSLLRRTFENVAARVRHRTRVHTTDLRQAAPEPVLSERRNTLGVDDLLADIRYELRRDRRTAVFVAILGVLAILLSIGAFVFVRSTYRWVIHYLAVKTNIIPANFPLNPGDPPS